MRDIRHLMLNGEDFEYKVMQFIQVGFPEARLIHNKRIFSSFLGKDTQIDVIAVTDNGVFVIEAKNWSGWLKGELSDEKWSGLSSDHRVKEIYNPFHQNFIHVRAIRNAIRSQGIEPAPFYNFVVVPDSTSVYSSCGNVINVSKLLNAMNSVKTVIDKNYYVGLLEGVLR